MNRSSSSDSASYELQRQEYRAAAAAARRDARLTLESGVYSHNQYVEDANEQLGSFTDYLGRRGAFLFDKPKTVREFPLDSDAQILETGVDEIATFEGDYDLAMEQKQGTGELEGQIAELDTQIEDLLSGGMGEGESHRYDELKRQRQRLQGELDDFDTEEWDSYQEYLKNREAFEQTVGATQPDEALHEIEVPEALRHLTGTNLENFIDMRTDLLEDQSAIIRMSREEAWSMMVQGGHYEGQAVAAQTAAETAERNARRNDVFSGLFGLANLAAGTFLTTLNPAAGIPMMLRGGGMMAGYY